MMFGHLLCAIIHSFVYGWLSLAWPPGIIPKAARIASLFFLTYLFWEFFTPFNLFWEPIPLIFLQLIFWASIALGEAFAVATVFEKHGLGAGGNNDELQQGASARHSVGC